jgi:hypothetical protein
MTYVEGSGVPEPSSSFGGELTWDLAGPPPAGGQDVVYRVRPQAPGEGPLSAAAVLNMVYADSTLGEIPLENPDVCVHSSTRPQDCADFIATLTPQVPTPTSTEGPTEQATAETSPTATRAPGWAIFVPDVHMP